MKFFEILNKGTAACMRTWRGMVILYAANVLLALAAALTFKAGLEAFFDSSMIAQVFLQGYDFTTMQDLMRRGAGLVSGWNAMLGWFVLLQMTVFAFVGGGIIVSVLGNDAGDMRTLLRNGAAFAGRFVRILLIEIAALMVLAVLAMIAAGMILSSTWNAASSEMSFLRALVGIAAVLTVVFGIPLSIGDYARIALVTDDERSAFRAVGRGAVFVFRNLLWVLLLDLVIALATAALFVGTFMLELRTPMSSGWTILLVFVLHQISMMLRMSAKVWNYSLGSALWKMRHASPALEKPGASPSAPAKVRLTAAPVEVMPAVEADVPARPAVRKRASIRRPPKKTKSPSKPTTPIRGRRKKRP